MEFIGAYQPTRAALPPAPAPYACHHPVIHTERNRIQCSNSTPCLISGGSDTSSMVESSTDIDETELTKVEVDESFATRLATVLQQCKSRLIGRRKELKALKRERDALHEALQDISGGFSEMGRKWQQLGADMKKLHGRKPTPHYMTTQFHDREHSMPCRPDRSVRSRSREDKDRSHRYRRHSTTSSLDRFMEMQETGKTSTSIKERRVGKIRQAISKIGARHTEAAVSRDCFAHAPAMDEASSSDKRRQSHSASKSSVTCQRDGFVGGCCVSNVYDIHAADGEANALMRSIEAALEATLKVEECPGTDQSMSLRKTKGVVCEAAPGPAAAGRGKHASGSNEESARYRSPSVSSICGTNYENYSGENSDVVPQLVYTISRHDADELITLDAQEDAEGQSRCRTVEPLERDFLRKASSARSHDSETVSSTCAGEDGMAASGFMGMGSTTAEHSIEETQNVSCMHSSVCPSSCISAIAAWELSSNCFAVGDRDVNANSNCDSVPPARMLGDAVLRDGAIWPGPCGGLLISTPMAETPLSVELWEWRPSCPGVCYCILSGGPQVDNVFFVHEFPEEKNGRLENDSDDGQRDDTLTRCDVKITAGGWNHHGFVFDANCISWFINGKLMQSIAHRVYRDSGLGLGEFVVGNNLGLCNGDPTNTAHFKRVTLHERELSVEDMRAIAAKGHSDSNWAVERMEAMLSAASKHCWSLPLYERDRHPTVMQNRDAHDVNRGTSVAEVGEQAVLSAQKSAESFSKPLSQYPILPPPPMSFPVPMLFTGIPATPSTDVPSSHGARTDITPRGGDYEAAKQLFPRNISGGLFRQQPNCRTQPAAMADVLDVGASTCEPPISTSHTYSKDSSRDTVADVSAMSSSEGKRSSHEVAMCQMQGKAATSNSQIQRAEHGSLVGSLPTTIATLVGHELSPSMIPPVGNTHILNISSLPTVAAALTAPVPYLGTLGNIGIIQNNRTTRRATRSASFRANFPRSMASRAKERKELQTQMRARSVDAATIPMHERSPRAPKLDVAKARAEAGLPPLCSDRRASDLRRSVDLLSVPCAITPPITQHVGESYVAACATHVRAHSFPKTMAAVPRSCSAKTYQTSTSPSTARRDNMSEPMLMLPPPPTPPCPRCLVQVSGNAEVAGAHDNKTVGSYLAPVFSDSVSSHLTTVEMPSRAPPVQGSVAIAIMPNDSRFQLGSEAPSAFEAERTLMAPALPAPSPLFDQFVSPSPNKKPSPVMPLGIEAQQLDEIVRIYLERRSLPLQLLRTDSGHYVYGGTRLELAAFPGDQEQKVKLKVRHPSHNTGNWIPLRKFAATFQAQCEFSTHDTSLDI